LFYLKYFNFLRVDYFLLSITVWPDGSVVSNFVVSARNLNYVLKFPTEFSKVED